MAESNLPVASAFTEKDMIIFDLQKQLEAEKEQNRYLEDQIRIRVTAFMNREASARKIVDALEERISKSTGDDGAFESKMKMLRDLHSSALHSIDQLQAGTASLLQGQEQELMRGFRLRFEEVSHEIDSLRNKKGDFNTELQNRLRKLTAELVSCQELAQILEAKNSQLFAENKKLSESLKSQQDDRQALLMELVVLKRSKSAPSGQNRPAIRSAIRISQKSSNIDKDSLPASVTKPKVVSHEVTVTAIAKLREEIASITAHLKQEKLLVAQLRAEVESLRRDKDDVDMFLIKCCNDVRLGLSKRNNSPYVAIADFAESDRRKILLELVKSDLLVQT